MTELERLATATDAAKRLGLIVGFMVGSFTSIVGTAFVIARWFVRCH